MRIITSIKQLLLYGGVSKDEFTKARHSMAEANRKSIVLFSGVMAVSMLILLAVSPFWPVLHINVYAYAAGEAAAILFFLLAYGPAKRSAAFTYALTHGFTATVLATGIVFGTLAVPHQASISYCVLMFAAPLIIVDRPLSTNLLTILGVVAYFLMAKHTQTPEMLAFNMSNVLPFGVISLFVTTFIMQMKVRSFVLQDKSEMLGEITQLNTRLEDANRSQSEVLRIIQHLAASYSALYYIDIRTGKFTELGRTNLKYIEELVGQEGEAQDRLDAFVSNIVLPEHRDDYSRFVQLSRVREQLKDRRFISKAYQGVHSGWSEGTFIAGERDEYGYCQWILWAVRNINELKKKELDQQEALKEAKEAADAANQAKTSFLFNMSHDIRTPMNAIIGFTNLLRKHQNDPEKRNSYLDKIEHSSGILLSIINNVLEMARIEKGNIQIEEIPCIAEDVNDTIISVFQETMKNKGISFTCTTSVEHHYVCIDPTKLREVIFNILSNAYKYTRIGGRVDMSLKELPSQREGYAIYQTTISDTGIGMSPEFLPHLFEEFSREDNTTGSKVEGTGLGMPIVKRLVGLMQGTIEVSSKKGEGTTFVLTLPHKIAQPIQASESASGKVDSSLFKGKRILLAEDNDLNAEIATEILDEHGFLVERATDGKQCVKMLTDATVDYYDIILMDIQMPQMDGYEATRVIRQMMDYQKARIPILAMTANAFEEDMRHALEVGMNGHLTKPINVTELVKALATYVGTRL